MTRTMGEAFPASLRGDPPPASGTPEQLRAWARKQAGCGQSEQGIAKALGWNVESVRRALGERAGIEG